MKLPKQGRPTKRTDENCAKLCAMIAGGSLVIDALNAIGASYSNLRDWEDQDEAFSQSIARARKQWASVMAEQECKVAMTPPRMIADAESGTERVDTGWVQHITSRLNYTRWLMGKRDPAYSDKQEATTVNVGVSVTNISVTEEQMAGIREKLRLANERAKAVEG